MLQKNNEVENYSQPHLLLLLYGRLNFCWHILRMIIPDVRYDHIVEIPILLLLLTGVSTDLEHFTYHPIVIVNNTTMDVVLANASLAILHGNTSFLRRKQR